MDRNFWSFNNFGHSIMLGGQDDTMVIGRVLSLRFLRPLASCVSVGLLSPVLSFPPKSNNS